MKIKLLKDCGFTVVEGIDDADNPIEVDENFHKDEIIDGKIIDDSDEYVSFQFEDGSMVFGLKKELFEIIEE